MTVTISTAESDTTPPAEDIEALLDITDEEFADVLTDAIMQANGPVSEEPDWQCLFAPEVVIRTAKALGKLNLRVQAQLGEASARLYAETLSKSELAEVRKVRGGLLLFRSRLISRSVEAKQIRERQHVARTAARPAQAENPVPGDERLMAHVERSDEQVRQLRNALRVVAFAIQDHRLAAIAAELAPEPQDRELWAVLDEVTVPHRTGTATLAEMLGSGVWTRDSA